MATRKKPQPVDPHTATESLRTALWKAGRIVLPSLTVDHASPALGLVVLGSARADVVARIADELARARRLVDEVAALERKLEEARQGGLEP
ncbi:hypothetical protein [Streptomyces longispororuber]|uniref:hypothetical protein n=1 Tax=Streptomyces longispororuber TaxID=68230 RepID=UPI00370005E9